VIASSAKGADDQRKKRPVKRPSIVNQRWQGVACYVKDMDVVEKGLATIASS